jgi:hypothetical protein
MAKQKLENARQLIGWRLDYPSCGKNPAARESCVPRPQIGKGGDSRLRPLRARRKENLRPRTLAKPIRVNVYRAGKKERERPACCPYRALVPFSRLRSIYGLALGMR